jgi:hypothetical protein
VLERGWASTSFLIQVLTLRRDLKLRWEIVI